MLVIQYEIVRTAALMVGGSLAAAAFAGFSLMKAYEEFCKGVAEKSRLRIWAAFFSVAFLAILFVTVIVRFSK